MVILGGLELVAAGYLFHKHNQNKREKRRLEAEAAALDEQHYPIFPDHPTPDPRPRPNQTASPHNHHHKHKYDRPSSQPQGPVQGSYGMGYPSQPGNPQNSWSTVQGQVQQPQWKQGAAASYYQVDGNSFGDGSRPSQDAPPGYIDEGRRTHSPQRQDANSPHVRFSEPPPAYRP